MAFMKYARAQVVHPHVNLNRWDHVRTASQGDKNISNNLIYQASEIFQKSFDPNDHLLSHVTIIAAVETKEVPNVKLGSLLENGKSVVRKYSDYLITPETQKFINNNKDSWSKQVLSKSYKTFIGAENFVEHIQVPELSKGKIIDAALRDIGDTFYVDILVATERKYKDLIASIESGRMGTLSMGCSILESTCTKCGNVAIDEPQMCQHVLYEKGNTFYDAKGQRHIIAELCGHHSLDDTGGVTFVEASWVENPAFRGAVLRNILSSNNVDPHVIKQAESVLNAPPKKWIAEGNISKKAFDFGEDTSEEESEDSSQKEQGLKEIEEEAYKILKKNLLKRFKKDLSEEEKEPISTEPSTSPNDTLIKEARSHMYGVEALIKIAKNDCDFINSLALYNEKNGVHIPVEIYRASLTVGSRERYASLCDFNKACQKVLGYTPGLAEQKVLIRLSTLLSKRSQKGKS